MWLDRKSYAAAECVEGFACDGLGWGWGSILMGPVGDGELAESLTPLMEV